MRVSRRSIFSLLRIMAMVAGLVLLAPINPGRATDGRDFAGFYEVSNVTDLGDTVRVTLTVRVRNYSDADVSAPPSLCKTRSISRKTMVPTRSHSPSPIAKVHGFRASSPCPGKSTAAGKTATPRQCALITRTQTEITCGE
jgi:hypothetical protein